MNHPLTNEDTLKNWLGSLTCNGCAFLKEGKCSHENAIKNEKNKPGLIEIMKNNGDPQSLKYAEDINSLFLCNNYEQRKK